MNSKQFESMKAIRDEIIRFMMKYKFALSEMETKIDILKGEFQSLHEYSPIEHTKTRLKSPESILKKMTRKNTPISISAIEEHIKDIAGIRITCSFVTDIYKVSEMLQNQNDLKVLKVKDYIKEPKPNGYQSLHLLIEVPVFLSDRVEHVCVEVQIRTIAMDFWASLEHKIFYKCNQSVPRHLLEQLKSAADSISALDIQMEQLNEEIQAIKGAESDEHEELTQPFTISNQQFQFPTSLLQFLDK